MQPYDMSDLTVVTKANVLFKENVYYNIYNLARIGEEQALDFNTNHLVRQNEPISKQICKNHFILLGEKDANAKTKPKDQIFSSYVHKIKGCCGI